MSEELTQAQQALGKTDLLDQLLKPEVQESLTTLVEQLPKLTEGVNLLTKTYDLAQNLLKFRFKDGKMSSRSFNRRDPNCYSQPFIGKYVR